jgi:hypothetical protein
MLAHLIGYLLCLLTEAVSVTTLSSHCTVLSWVYHSSIHPAGHARRHLSQSRLSWLLTVQVALMYQKFLGRAMTQGASRPYHSAEDRVQSQASPCGICSGENCTATSFSPGTSIFYCQHHSDNASYPFIRHPRYMNLATDSFVKSQHL